VKELCQLYGGRKSKSYPPAHNHKSIPLTLGIYSSRDRPIPAESKIGGNRSGRGVVGAAMTLSGRYTTHVPITLNGGKKRSRNVAA
jgi:hypothetical protein